MKLESLTKAQLIDVINGNVAKLATVLDLEQRIAKARACYRDQRSEITGLQDMLATANPSRFHKAKRVLTGAAKAASVSVQARARKIGEASAIVKELIINAASSEQIAAAKERVQSAIAER